MSEVARAVGGWRLEVVDEIGSTSDALIGRAGAGEVGRMAMLARRQTRARGSRGRSWVEPPAGNLAMSVLLRPDWGSDEVGACVFAAGLALHGALLGWAEAEARLTLKWPNDVLLGGRKLGGVLVETGRQGTARVDWVVIGFGANLLSAPLVPGRATACLAECAARSPDAGAVGQAVLGALDRWLMVLEGEGFEAVRDAWLAVAHPAGTLLTVGGVEGRFEGLTPRGELLLRSGGSVAAIRTGDVMLAGG